MFKLSIFALLVIVPAARTVVDVVLGSNNGAILETSCVDTSSFWQRTGGSILASKRKRRDAGQGAEGAPSTACEVATESKIAEAAKSQDPNEVSKQIAMVVCTPSNYADCVSSCNEAVKAATVSKGFDLSKVEGCEMFQYIDNRGRLCLPQAV